MKLKQSKKKDQLKTQIDLLSKKNTSLIDLNKKYSHKWNEFYMDFKIYESSYLEFLNPSKLSCLKGKGTAALSGRSNILMSSFSTKISSNRNGARFKCPLSPQKATEEIMNEFKYNSVDEFIRKKPSRSNLSMINPAGSPLNESLLNYNNCSQANNEKEVLSEKSEMDAQET